jgi:hypothetical protein
MEDIDQGGMSAGKEESYEDSFLLWSDMDKFSHRSGSASITNPLKGEQRSCQCGYGKTKTVSYPYHLQWFGFSSSIST